MIDSVNTWIKLPLIKLIEILKYLNEPKLFWKLLIDQINFD